MPKLKKKQVKCADYNLRVSGKYPVRD